MNQLINDIYTELKAKYGISRTEIERITDSQFKVAEDNIRAYTMKDIKWINLGKIRPSEYIKHKKAKDERQAAKFLKKDEDDNSGLEKCNIQEPSN